MLVVAGAWLVLCTMAFHGVLELQLTMSGGLDSDLTDRECTGLLHRHCVDRLAIERAKSVRDGMLHAWEGYKAFAWGADEIHPKSKTAKTDIMVLLGWGGVGCDACCWRWWCCDDGWQCPLLRGCQAAYRHTGCGLLLAALP